VFSGLYPEGVINTPRRLGQYLSMRAAAMFGVMGYKQNAAEALGKADALNFLLKVGQEHIKSQFAKLPGDWHSEIKNSANEKVTGETDMTQIAYGSQPGCESPTPSIFVDTNNGKYRYAYTEIITNRQPNKPIGDKQYGMVYIPTQEERLTLGSFENNAPFVSTIVPMRRGDAEVPYRNVKANLQKDDQITRIYHKCSTDTFLHINQIGEENIITESDYDNEAMFNIFGGSKFMDTAEKIREEYGSFCDYLWGYAGGKTILYKGHAQGSIPVSNGLSDRISKDLKKRGFKFIGSITIYSHLQACGIINDHADDCPCFYKINAEYPTVNKEPEEEVF
jgi:hypothetical protein